MNLRLYRRLDRWGGAAICRCLAGVHLVGRVLARRGSDSPRNILIIQISELGSLVLSYTMLSTLLERYPEARLHFLVFAGKRQGLGALDLVPEDRILCLDERGPLRFAASALRAAFRMRARRIDTVLDLELFSRAGSILSYLSGARSRVGFHRHTMEGLYRGNWITHPVAYNPYRHIFKNHMALVDALASRGRPLVKVDHSKIEPRVPPIRFPEGIETRMRARLEEACPNIDLQAPIVLLNPGGGDLPIRAWPLENYVELARSLLAGRDIQVGVIGLDRDSVHFTRIAERVRSGRLFDLTGKTRDLKELIQVFNLCHVLVTSDSGAAQFAALSRIHAIVFFGPETPDLYGPLTGEQTCLYAGLSCSPCLTAYNHRDTPCDGNNVCMKTFTPQNVEGIVLEKLGKRFPSEPAAAGGPVRPGLAGGARNR